MEQMRSHRGPDSLDERLSETHPEPAADDHRLDVEQVHGPTRRRPRAR